MGLKQVVCLVFASPVKMLQMFSLVVQFCVMTACAGLPVAYRARWLHSIVNVSLTENDMADMELDRFTCEVIVDKYDSLFSGTPLTSFEETANFLADNDPNFSHICLSTTRERCHLVNCKCVLVSVFDSMEPKVRDSIGVNGRAMLYSLKGPQTLTWIKKEGSKCGREYYTIRIRIP